MKNKTFFETMTNISFVGIVFTVLAMLWKSFGFLAIVLIIFGFLFIVGVLNQ